MYLTLTIQLRHNDIAHRTAQMKKIKGVFVSNCCCNKHRTWSPNANTDKAVIIQTPICRSNTRSLWLFCFFCNEGGHNTKEYNRWCPIHFFRVESSASAFLGPACFLNWPFRTFLFFLFFFCTFLLQSLFWRFEQTLLHATIMIVSDWHRVVAEYKYKGKASCATKNCCNRQSFLHWQIIVWLSRALSIYGFVPSSFHARASFGCAPYLGEAR